MSTATDALVSLTIAPAQVLRGFNAIEQLGDASTPWGKAFARLGSRPLVVGGDQTLELIKPRLKPVFKAHHLANAKVSYGKDCSEAGLDLMRQAVTAHQADF